MESDKKQANMYWLVEANKENLKKNKNKKRHCRIRK